MLQLIEFLLSVFVFLLPWQARFLFRAGELHGGFWEYGTIAMYATDILFILILLLIGVRAIQRRFQLPITDFQFPNKSQFSISKSFIGYWILGIGYFFFSIFWSFDKPVALYAALKLLEGIALFLLIRGLPVDRTKLIWAFIASAVVQSVLAIAQFFSQSVFAWPFSGIASQDPSDLGVAVVQFGDERWLRAYGSFPHPNVLGAFIVIAAILLFTKLFRSRDGESRITNQESGTLKFIIHNSCFIILIVGLFFTFSRAAWIAFFVGLVVYAVQTKAWREKVFLQFTLLLVVIATVFTVLFFPLVRTRIGGGSRLEIKSNQERTVGYREALQIIKRHPFIGVGIGNYTAAVARELRSNDPAWSYQPAHNVFLLILSELGLVGFIFLLGSVWQTKKFFLHHSSFIIPLLILSLLDHSFWTLHAGILLFWIGMGLTEA